MALVLVKFSLVFVDLKGQVEVHSPESDSQDCYQASRRDRVDGVTPGGVSLE
jgi:hypothetical protein